MVPKMRPARREATLRLERFRVPEQPGDPSRRTNGIAA